MVIFPLFHRCSFQSKKLLFNRLWAPRPVAQPTFIVADPLTSLRTFLSKPLTVDYVYCYQAWRRLHEDPKAWRSQEELGHLQGLAIVTGCPGYGYGCKTLDPRKTRTRDTDWRVEERVTGALADVHFVWDVVIILFTVVIKCTNTDLIHIVREIHNAKNHCITV